MLAIYSRRSQEDENSNSIDNQIREGEEFARTKEFEFELYNEGEGVSGGTTSRPVLDKMLGDIERGLITAVWCRDQDRLERDTDLFIRFTALCTAASVQVYFGGRLWDFNDPKDKFFGKLLSSYNQYTRELQGYKTKKALLDNIKLGKAHGILPYGYRRDENKMLVIDEDEAKQVEKIFELSLEGKGTDKIAQMFNEWKVPTRLNSLSGNLTLPHGRKVPKKSLKWAGNTIRNIIRNTIYKGERNWSGRVVDCPAILDPEYWQKVNDNFKNNSNTRGRKVEHRYLLKGIIKCGRCGRNYYGRSRVDKSDHYYMCSSKRRGYENCGNRSINIDFIEGLVWFHLTTEDGFRTLANEYFEELISTDKIGELIKQKELISKRITESKTEVQRLVKAVRKGQLEDEDITGQMTAIKQEKNSLEVELVNINSQIKSLQPNSDELDQINLELSMPPETNISFNDRKELVHKYIKEVRIQFNDKEESFQREDYQIEISPRLNWFSSPTEYLAPFNKKYAFAVRAVKDDHVISFYPKPGLEESLAAIKDRLLEDWAWMKSNLDEDE